MIDRPRAANIVETTYSVVPRPRFLVA
jgi:hypothetical protein